MKRFAKSVVLMLAMLTLLCNTVASIAGADTIAIDASNFPDANFRSYVTRFDVDGDGCFSVSEREAVKRISVVGKSISDVKGIERFPNLEYLFCSQNMIKSIDLSANTKLKALNIGMNIHLETLDVSANKELYWLGCIKTGISSLDIRNNAALTYLECGDNHLTEIDLSQNVLLEELAIESNPIMELDLSCNPLLKRLSFSNTPLTSLDLSNQVYTVIMQYEEMYYPCSFASNPMSLSVLGTGFDTSRTSNWVDSNRIGDKVYIAPGATEVSYDYDCGNGQTVTFTLTSSVAASTFEPVMWADLTGDDRVDSADLQYLNQHIGRPAKYKLPIGVLADYTQDGSVSVADLQYLNQHIGRPSKYPIPSVQS